ncbi:MAG: hypothetical protein HFG25_07780 [Lachnospiraceae bacterium]|nr:hypothetical protein [Lachnospiraceae bacterium]
MKKGKILWALLLWGVLSLLFPRTAQASEALYETFTLDVWGNAVPSPDGYVPVRSVSGSQIGCGDFNNGADLFYNAARREIYVVDAGNARILVLNEELEFVREYDRLTRPDGSEYTLSNPQGIFVEDDGTMYIAESGNQEVVICNARGEIEQIFGTPETPLLSDDFDYRPSKIVVDDRGRIYVLAKGVYQGMIYLEPDGSFIKFFGARSVTMSWTDYLEKAWQKLLSDEAAATMQAFVPLEYSNIFMDPQGYIYGTVIGEKGTDLVSRINPVGINALSYKVNGKLSYVDVAADEYGILTLLDAQYGSVDQLNENGKPLFMMGGQGDRAGLFRRPVSLIQVQGSLYILDGDKNTITELGITEFGRLVHNAVRLYNEGLYEESIEPWKEVIRRNANYLAAYTGLGKAYYQMEDYDTAMYYYRLAGDKEGYSLAYKEASLNRIRNSFGAIVLCIVLLTAAVALWRKYRIRKRQRKGAAV